MRLDVRLVDLDSLAGTLEAIDQRLGLLSAVECGWAMAPDPLRSRRRRTARIALRLLLYCAGETGARGQPFTQDGNGKPALAVSAFSFNVSHSGNIALLAVASSGPVGIDVEQPRSVSLGPQRQALIISAASATAAEPIGPGEFLVAWTRLEAFAKARATGIGTLLTELGITAQGVRTLSSADVAERAAELLRTSGLALQSFGFPYGLVGAICAPARILAAGPEWKWLTEQHALDIVGVS